MENDSEAVAVDFDFGFTVVDGSELIELSRREPNSLSDLVKRSDSISEIIKLIEPLLDNLSSQPEKDYIYWPNRLNRIDAFRKKLHDIYNDSK